MKNQVRLVQEKKQKQKQKQPSNTVPVLLETDEKFNNLKEEDMIKKSTVNKKRRREKDKNVDVRATLQITTADNSIKTRREREKNKVSRKKKRKNDDAIGTSDHPDIGIKDCSVEKNDEEATSLRQYETSGKNGTFQGLRKTDSEAEIRIRKPKKDGKNKKKNHALSMESGKVPESSGEAVPDNVYHISSADKDFSKGMKKWIMEYHQSRPGLKTLQQRIDDFIVAHEEKLEQETQEKLARAAEGGWTVVVHHKGRKKTTDSDTGITVGSVAQAAVEDKMAKKKSKEVGLDFYRFQRKEAQRNQIMMLQSKFEEDRKRIQQLRAARKFRPY